MIWMSSWPGVLTSSASKPIAIEERLHPLDRDEVDVLGREDVGMLPEHLNVEPAAGPGRGDQDAPRGEDPVGLGQEGGDVTVVLQDVEGRDKSGRTGP